MTDDPELKLLKKALREYKKDRKKTRDTIKDLQQAIGEFDISLFKCWDEKQKARLRCKKVTALGKLDTAQAHEHRLTRYINELKREQIRKGSERQEN